jgi:O-antigen/teichoic acid export membrane protein
MLASAAGYIYLKLDQVMVKFFLGEVAVGYYAAAVRLSEIWYFIPGIICSSLFPAIINARLTNRSKYITRLKWLLTLLGIIALSIALPIYLLSGYIVRLLYGKDFLATIPVLQVYVWSSVGMFLSIAVGQYFMAENNLKMIFYLNTLAMFLNVLLNVILLPRVGLVGAAWSTLVSYSFGPLIFVIFIFFKKIFKQRQYGV